MRAKRPLSHGIYETSVALARRRDYKNAVDDDNANETGNI